MNGDCVEHAATQPQNTRTNPIKPTLENAVSERG